MSASGLYNLQLIECETSCEYWNQIRDCASQCHFWSLDLEFSGLGNVKKLNVENVEDRFTAIRQLTRQYAVLEVGIAFFGDFRSVFGSHWHRHASICYRIPCYRKGHFTSNSSAMAFLARQGLKLNNVFTKGLPYDVTANKWDPQHTLESAESTLTYLLRLVVKYAYPKPLIVHNGWIDLMHLHNIIIGPVPATSSAWVNEMVQYIPTVVDTKYVAATLWSSADSVLEKLYMYTLSTPDDDNVASNGDVETRHMDNATHTKKRKREERDGEEYSTNNELFDAISQSIKEESNKGMLETLRGRLGVGEQEKGDIGHSEGGSYTSGGQGSAHCASFDAFMTGRIFFAAVRKTAESSQAQPGATATTEDKEKQLQLQRMESIISWTMDKQISSKDSTDVSPLVLYGLLNKLYLTHKEVPLLLIKRHSF